MKLVTVVGARPQFVKASALSREIKKHSDVEEVIIHTGQHFDPNMSDVFFKELEIPAPKYQLDINSLTHGAMTGRMLEQIEKILIGEKPDYVIVYGDTNSTLAGALAASKLHIKIAHIEAGLRSFNMAMPEEINRILTDRISDILFCPTTTAIHNLHQEGMENCNNKIVLCGDIMYDAALFYKAKSDLESTVLQDLNLTGNGFVLATIHRQENTDDPMRLANIIEALNDIHRHTQVIVPLHPRTKKIIESKEINTHFTIIDPVGYLDMISLTSHAAVVITDSGGLQKEAYFFSKYCITLRDQTEWVELVDGGFNVLAGADKKSISEAYHHFLDSNIVFDNALYGDGHAAAKILKELR